jgi:hypothetical protein
VGKTVSVQAGKGIKYDVFYGAVRISILDVDVVPKPPLNVGIDRRPQRRGAGSKLASNCCASSAGCVDLLILGQALRTATEVTAEVMFAPSWTSGIGCAALASKGTRTLRSG